MPNSLQPQVYVHGSKLKNKAVTAPELQPLLEIYARWKNQSLAVEGRTDEDIFQLTAYLNEYKNAVESTFDARANSAQEVLQPSILEEFFEYLFCRLDAELQLSVLRRPDSGFIDLAFNPKSLRDLMTSPDYTIRRKDHDFVIGASVEMKLTVPGGNPTQTDTLVIPAVAIECKRYLERNMLDECSGTAEKIKKSTPYCLYIIASEYLKMDDASPELSRIDEIYVLRKQRNSERLAEGFVPNPIYGELVVEIYRQVQRHLNRVWWNPQSAITNGKAFNFPG